MMMGSDNHMMGKVIDRHESGGNFETIDIVLVAMMLSRSNGSYLLVIWIP